MTFTYAGETFIVLRRGTGRYKGYLVCRTWLGVCLFREDRHAERRLHSHR
jgi:hypothetical protein